jgi:hypothetical protein
MLIISAIFETISSGKLYVIDPVFSFNCGGLGAPFLTHFLMHVKRSLKLLFCQDKPRGSLLTAWVASGIKVA